MCDRQCPYQNSNMDLKCETCKKLVYYFQISETVAENNRNTCSDFLANINANISVDDKNFENNLNYSMIVNTGYELLLSKSTHDRLIHRKSWLVFNLILICSIAITCVSLVLIVISFYKKMFCFSQAKHTPENTPEKQGNLKMDANFWKN
jgi:hypothetical protein